MGNNVVNNINGLIGKAKIPANVAVYGGGILVAATLAWYDLTTSIDAVALQQRITGCEVAEMRQVMIDKKPFRYDCYRLVQAWVDGKISDIKPGQ